jgi:hypothetical protein
MAFQPSLAGLVTISHRFRAFLAWSGLLILFGLLASMYNVVRTKSDNLTFFNSGDLIVSCLSRLSSINACGRNVSFQSILHLHTTEIRKTSEEDGWERLKEGNQSTYLASRRRFVCVRPKTGICIFFHICLFYLHTTPEAPLIEPVIMIFCLQNQSRSQKLWSLKQKEADYIT